MDLPPFIGGALIGAIAGIAWGLLPFEKRRPNGIGWLASFVVFAASAWIFERVLPIQPVSFWICLIAAGWLFEPIGERIRGAASGRGTPARASRETPSSHP